MTKWIWGAGAVALLCATPASAAIVLDADGNNTLGTATNLDGSFSDEAQAEVPGGGATPHVTARRSMGAGLADPFDYFSFTVAAPSTLATFDVDHGAADDTAVNSRSGSGGVDTRIVLFDGVTGVILDDSVNNTNTEPESALTCNQPFQPACKASASSGPLGDPGSGDDNAPARDPFYMYTFATPGLYKIGIAFQPTTAASDGTGFPGGNPLLAVDSYDLHIVIPGHAVTPSGGAAVPEPASMMLFGLASIGGLAGRRMRKQQAAEA